MSALVLASASPRRKALLAQLMTSFVVRAANIDETPKIDESPSDYVARMAREKALAVLKHYPHPQVPVLASDTSVVSGVSILGKPVDTEDARVMLRRLSGSWHSVFSAVHLVVNGCEFCCIEETRVKFTPVTDQQISAYLETDEPWDKAGSYAIQGLAGAFVERIDGSYSNVVGLPLSQTHQLLVAAGIATRLSGVACD